MKALAIRWGNFFFRHRNRLFPALMVAGLFFVRPRTSGQGYACDLGRYLLGLLICLTGQSVRALTVGYDYIKRGGKQQQIWAGRLVHRGLFAHTRNPLYLGNILIFAGLVLVIHHPVGYLVGLPLVLGIYQCMVFAEEDFLARKFGAEYQSYLDRVPRWWPDLRGFSGSVASLTFQWRRVLNKEYGTTFAWMAVALGLRLWMIRRTGPTPHPTESRYLLVLLVAACSGYAVIRWWKKTGRLAEIDPGSIDG